MAREPNSTPETTSAWVIQEAAFALAHRKPVVRLLEKGISVDGKIFGDQEHIVFDRADMAKAIVDLARMLGGLKTR